MNFSEILKDKNKNSIRNIIKGYKDTSKESNQDVEINLGFAIPNYDIILDAIGCNDCGDPIINESFGDELYFKFLSIFKTELVITSINAPCLIISIVSGKFTILLLFCSI